MPVKDDLLGYHVFLVQQKQNLRKWTVSFSRRVQTQSRAPHLDQTLEGVFVSEAVPFDLAQAVELRLGRLVVVDKHRAHVYEELWRKGSLSNERTRELDAVYAILGI